MSDTGRTGKQEDVFETAVLVQKLTMRAAQEAMRESRADIADLATEIAKLRA